MKKYIILIIIFTLAISCTKEETGLDVSITGFVRLINQNGLDLFEKNDVKVSIQGTSHYAQTDKNGKFLFEGLKAGSPYSFDFSKDGYGTKGIGKYKFIGNQKPGLISTVTLYQMPEVVMQSASIEYVNKFISISGQITPVNNHKLQAYANDSINVSESHYDYSSYQYSVTGGINITSFSISIPMTQNTYKPGTVIYVAIYFYNYYEENYWDQEKLLWRRSSAKKVGVVNITL